MRACFVGKGGSGKTTLSTLFSKYLASKNLPVLAIDADINQHMQEAFGIDEKIKALGEHQHILKEFFAGENTNIDTYKELIKTTPPGTGSRLIQFDENHLVRDTFEYENNGIRLMCTGAFSEEDMGTRCFHSKTGAVEMYLNHLIDGKGEYVIVDMTAGADAFASGIFTKFDITFLVCEPTIKSVSVYKQYKKYASEFDVPIAVIGNKVEDEEDLKFIVEHIGQNLLAVFGKSQYVKSLERGSIRDISELEEENKEVFEKMLKRIDIQEKNWDRYYEQMVYFHKKMLKVGKMPALEKTYANK